LINVYDINYIATQDIYIVTFCTGIPGGAHNIGRT
jgi:hypothetical protein